MIINNIFDNLELSLNSDMNIKIEHNLEDGKFREYLVKNLLSKITPSKYSITNGFIIDSNNNRSKEMDIIIYDKNYVPPFFDETYSIIPIESVIAIIQVKTTLTSDTMKDSIDNLESIEKLESKVGGKIISANGSELIEGRYIKPFKIVIAHKSTIKELDKKSYLDKIDMIYVVDKDKPLVVKHRLNIESVVNKSKEKLEAAQKNYEIEVINKNKLSLFSLYYLDKIKLINNSLIINYGEYIKGVKNYE